MTLRVVTPAGSIRLATLAALKAELQISEGDTSKDSHLESLLDQASSAIARHCNRVFAREGLSETFRLARPLGTLMLARVPVAAVTEVIEDGAALGADTDFECDTESGLLHRLGGDCEVLWSARKVVVSYTAGWTLPTDDGVGDLPPDVSRACILAASAWYSGRGRDPMLRSESQEGVGSASYIATAEMGALPPQAISLLEDGGYRLYAVG